MVEVPGVGPTLGTDSDVVVTIGLVTSTGGGASIVTLSSVLAIAMIAAGIGAGEGVKRLWYLRINRQLAHS